MRTKNKKNEKRNVYKTPNILQRYYYRAKTFFKDLDISIEFIFILAYISIILFLKRYVGIMNNIPTYIAILGVMTAAAVWFRNYFESRANIELKLIEKLPVELPNKPWGLDFPFYAFDISDNLYIFIPIIMINRSKQNNCIYSETYAFKMKEDAMAWAIPKVNYSNLNIFGYIDEDISEDCEELRLPFILKSYTAVKKGIILKIRREFVNEFIPKEELQKKEEFQIEIWIVLRSLKGKIDILRKKFNIKHKFNDNYKRITDVIRNDNP